MGVSTIVAGLRELRRRRYLTQRQLGDAAGISASTIAQIELGNHTPYLATRVKIAEALGVSPDEIEWPEPQPGATDTDAGDA